MKPTRKTPGAKAKETSMHSAACYRAANELGKNYGRQTFTYPEPWQGPPWPWCNVTPG